MRIEDCEEDPFECLNQEFGPGAHTHSGGAYGTSGEHQIHPRI